MPQALSGGHPCQPRQPFSTIGAHASALDHYLRLTVTIIEVFIAVFLPPLSVAMKKGLSSKVLIALLLQLCGHIPGVIYGT